MATNFKITPVKQPATKGGHYEKVSEHRDEMKRIVAVEKELKRHESLGMDKAHKGK